uniref:MARVEL domain-containing protein n=1 Tax=Panagrellus redivivus TaxID=6233 RepID=A0A7E4WE09_PANRE
MGWNPCCCWKLKDACVTIGIWSALFAIIQLSIFGWQMAAIKYERDRAANTLLPNYNTYGRYDIPSYYESYWQSPEERYYTGLFVIQVLCLIVSFFLLFASVALIYGVHIYSRFLIWPWFPCMIGSILTSTAYCVMWWSGDVRDYWLVLTILEIFGVFVNVYMMVVVIVFYQRMNRDIEYYEGKRTKSTRKYDRFNTVDASPPLEPDNNLPPRPQTEAGFRNQWDEHERWYPDSKYPPPPPDPYFEPNVLPYPGYSAGTMSKRRYDNDFPPDLDPPLGDTGPDLHHAQSVPSLFDDFRDVPRRSSQRRRSSRRHRSCHCGHDRRSKSRHRSRSRCRHCDCSEAASSEFSVEVPSESTESRCHHSRRHRHRRHRDDEDSDASTSHCSCQRRSKGESRRGPRQVKQRDRDSREMRHSGTQADPDLLASSEPTTPFANPAGGFTIPQHIVIPPADPGLDADGNAQPRKYHINSEITISYDPKQQQAPSPKPEVRNQGPTPRRNQPVSITSNV